jgi:hypothetical protein
LANDYREAEDRGAAGSSALTDVVRFHGTQRFVRYWRNSGRGPFYECAR